MLMTRIAILLLCTIIISCSGKKHLDISSVKGNVAVQFVGVNSKYTWNFVRSINSTLKIVQQGKPSNAMLTDIYFTSQMLIGLNFKESKLILFNRQLRDSAVFFPKADSAARNKSILYFDYKGNEIILYDFGSRSVKKISLDSLKFKPISI